MIKNEIVELRRRCKRRGVARVGYLRIQYCILGLLCLFHAVTGHASSFNTSLPNMVQGIISYARWSPQPNPIKLCVIDSPQYVNIFKNIALPNRPITVLAKNWNTPNLSSQCNVLFFDRTPPSQQQAIINRRGANDLLTITLNYPSCIIGSSFCISRVNGILSFNVNLDSLNRSGVKVSPNVLMLARPLDDR